jgi:hypothetical protein
MVALVPANRALFPIRTWHVLRLRSNPLLYFMIARWRSPRGLLLYWEPGPIRLTADGYTASVGAIDAPRCSIPILQGKDLLPGTLDAMDRKPARTPSDRQYTLRFDHFATMMLPHRAPSGVTIPRLERPRTRRNRVSAPAPKSGHLRNVMRYADQDYANFALSFGSRSNRSGFQAIGTTAAHSAITVFLLFWRFGCKSRAFGWRSVRRRRQHPNPGSPADPRANGGATPRAPPRRRPRSPNGRRSRALDLRSASARHIGCARRPGPPASAARDDPGRWSVDAGRR